MTGRSRFVRDFFFLFSFYPTCIVYFLNLYFLYLPFIPLPLSVLALEFLFRIVTVFSSFLYNFRDPIFVRAIVCFKAGLFCAGIFTIWFSTTVSMRSIAHTMSFMSLRARSLHVPERRDGLACSSMRILIAHSVCIIMFLGEIERWIIQCTYTWFGQRVKRQHIG